MFNAVTMGRKYLLLFVIILAVVFLSGCTTSSELEKSIELEDGIKNCGPDRCPVGKYRQDSTSCNCIFIGVGDQRAEENSPEVDPAGKITYATFSKPCNLELSDRNLLLEGVNTVRWLSDTLMEVNVIATASCASGIKSSGIRMAGKSITLWYSVATIAEPDRSPGCRCGHEVVYWIRGLDQNEQYPITLQELE